MSKTVSARLPENKHDKLRERCNNLGCSVNDFVKSSIEFALDSNTDFNFGDDESPKTVEEPKVILNKDKFKDHHDKYGNYWTCDKNTQKWTCHINLDKVKIIS